MPLHPLLLSLDSYARRPPHVQFIQRVMSGKIIAVDMDDVLAQTNIATTEWHNSTYGTDMSIDKYYYFHYWKNEHWGSPDEVFAKLAIFFKSGGYRDCLPVPFAQEALATLKGMGYRLVVITARSHEHSEISEAWINQYFPGIFEEIIFTSAFAPSYVAKGKVNRWAGRTKAEVISALGAVLLIDDSLENALTCAKAGIPVLLFGTYQWNRRASTTTSPMDHLSHAERITAGDDLYWERDVVKELPSCIQRVAGWEEVLEWLHREGHRVCRQEAAIENEHEMSEAVAVVE